MEEAFKDFMVSVLEAQKANRKSEISRVLSILAGGCVITTHSEPRPWENDEPEYFNWVTGEKIDDINAVPLGSMDRDNVWVGTHVNKAIRPEWMSEAAAVALETFVWESVGMYEEVIAALTGWKLEDVEWAVSNLTPEDVR